MRGALLAALLVLTASCKDEGVEQHRAALEKYSGCVTRAVPAADPCFDEVLVQLAAIARGSSARPRADALRDALLTARQPKLRTPLAVQGGANLPADVTAQLHQCQKLAEELGKVTDSRQRNELIRLIDACRARAEKLDLAHEHEELDGGQP